MSAWTEKTNLKMRKQPAQSRSDFTVNVILEAASKIVADKGLDHLTTNAIAEIAGVSVGSIYQYFPGTESIIAELRHKHRAEIRDSLQESQSSGIGKSFEEFLRLMVSAMVEVHERNPKLHFWLAKYHDAGLQVGPEEPRFNLAPTENSLFIQFIVSQEFPLTHAMKMGRVMYEIIDSLLHAALIHDELHLPANELVEEVMCVLLGYFERSGINTSTMIQK